MFNARHHSSGAFSISIAPPASRKITISVKRSGIIYQMRWRRHSHLLLFRLLCACLEQRQRALAFARGILFRCMGIIGNMDIMRLWRHISLFIAS